MPSRPASEDSEVKESVMTAKFIGLIAFVVAVAGATSAFGGTMTTLLNNFKSNITLKANPQLAPLHVSCGLGSAEFTNSLYLINDGPRAIPAGTRIHWVVDLNVKRKGNYTLVAALLRGKNAGVNLPTAVPNYAGCSASIVASQAGPSKANPGAIISNGVITNLITNLQVPPLKLACKAQGSPPDFPSDLLLTNIGATAVPSGTRIRWAMNYDHSKNGNYQFTASLSQGKSRYVPGVAGGTGRGAPCTVSYLK